MKARLPRRRYCHERSDTAPYAGGHSATQRARGTGGDLHELSRPQQSRCSDDRSGAECLPRQDELEP